MPPRKSQATPLRPEVQRWNTTVEDVKKALDERKGEKDAKGLQSARESFCKGAKIMLKLLNDPSFPEKSLREFQEWSENEFPDHRGMIEGPAFAKSLLALLHTLLSLVNDTSAARSQPGSTQNASEQSALLKRMVKAVRLIILMQDALETANITAGLSGYTKDRSPYLDKEWFDILLSFLDFAKDDSSQYRELIYGVVEMLEISMGDDHNGKYQTWAIDSASAKARTRLGALIMDSKSAILSLRGLRSLVWSFIAADPLKPDKDEVQSRYDHLLAAVSRHPSWGAEKAQSMRLKMRNALAGLPTKVSKRPRNYMYMINAVHTLHDDKPQGFPLTACELSREDLRLIQNDQAKKRLRDGEVILYIDETGIYINDFSEENLEEPCFIEHWRAVGCFRHDDPHPNRFEWTLIPSVPGGQDCLVTIEVESRYADKFEAALKKWFPPATWLAAVHQIGNLPPAPLPATGNSNPQPNNHSNPAPNHSSPDNNHAAPDHDSPGPDNDQTELVPDSSPQRQIGKDLSSIGTHASDSFGPFTAPDGKSQRNAAGPSTRGRPATRGKPGKGGKSGESVEKLDKVASLPVPSFGKKSTKASAKAVVVNHPTTAPAQIETTSKSTSRASKAKATTTSKEGTDSKSKDVDIPKPTSSSSRPSRAAKSDWIKKTAGLLGGEAVSLPDEADQPDEGETEAVEQVKVTSGRRGRPPKVLKEKVMIESVAPAEKDVGDDGDDVAIEAVNTEQINGGDGDKDDGLAGEDEEVLAAGEDNIPEEEIVVEPKKRGRGRPKGKGKAVEKGKGKGKAVEEASSVDDQPAAEVEEEEEPVVEEVAKETSILKAAEPAKSRSIPLARAASLQDIPVKKVDALSRSRQQYIRDKPTSKNKKKEEDVDDEAGSDNADEEQPDEEVEAPIIESSKPPKSAKPKQTPMKKSTNPRDKTTPLAESSANILPKSTTRAKVTLKPKQPKETLAAAIKAGQAMTPDKVQEKLASAGKKKGSAAKEAKGKKVAGPPKAVIGKKASTAPGQIEEVDTSAAVPSSVIDEVEVPDQVKPEEEDPIPQPTPKKVKSVTPPSNSNTRQRLPRGAKAQSVTVEDEAEGEHEGLENVVRSGKDDDDVAAPAEDIPDLIEQPAPAFSKSILESKSNAIVTTSTSTRPTKSDSPAKDPVVVPNDNASPLRSALRKPSPEVPVLEADSPTSRRSVAFSDPVEPIQRNISNTKAKIAAKEIPVPVIPSDSPKDFENSPIAPTKSSRKPVETRSKDNDQIVVGTKRKAEETVEDVPQSGSRHRRSPVEPQQPKPKATIQKVVPPLPESSKISERPQGPENASNSDSITRAQREDPTVPDDVGKKRKVSIQEPESAERESTKRRKLGTELVGREGKGKGKAVAIDGVLSVIDEIANSVKLRIAERLDAPDKVISSIDLHVTKVAGRSMDKFGIDHNTTYESLQLKIDSIHTKEAELQAINKSHSDIAKTQLRETRDSFFKTYQKPMEGIPKTLFD